MQIIRKENIEETKATLNETDFIKNPDNTVEIIHSLWDSTVSGLKTQYWLIIGAVTITIVTLAIFTLF